jgi:hypothetical protein
MENSQNPYQPPDSRDPLLEAYDQREPSPKDNDRYQAAEARWPRCPDCDQFRITRCPYCKTVGIRFPLADENFSRPEFFEDDSSTDQEGSPISTCGCNSGHCDSTTSEAEIGEHVPPSEENPAELTLLCPVCDEAFLPVFARQCEWCNHAFSDGELFYVEQNSQLGGPVPLLSAAVQEMGYHPRIILVLLAVLGLVGLGSFYFWWVIS